MLHRLYIRPARVQVQTRVEGRRRDPGEPAGTSGPLGPWSLVWTGLCPYTHLSWGEVQSRGPGRIARSDLLTGHGCKGHGRDRGQDVHSSTGGRAWSVEGYRVRGGVVGNPRCYSDGLV